MQFFFTFTPVLPLFFNDTVMPAFDNSHKALNNYYIICYDICILGTDLLCKEYTTPTKTAIIVTIEPVSAGVFGYYLQMRYSPILNYLVLS